MFASNVTYLCLGTSCCNSLLNFKLNSKIPFRFAFDLKSRGHHSKIAKWPILYPGARNMEYFNNLCLNNKLLPFNVMNS